MKKLLLLGCIGLCITSIHSQGLFKPLAKPVKQGSGLFHSKAALTTNPNVTVFRPDLIVFNGMDGKGNNYVLGGTGVSLNGTSWDDINERYLQTWKVGLYLFGKVATNSTTPKSFQDVGAFGIAGGYKLYTAGVVYAPSSKTVIYSIGISTSLTPFN